MASFDILYLGNPKMIVWRGARKEVTYIIEAFFVIYVPEVRTINMYWRLVLIPTPSENRKLHGRTNGRSDMQTCKNKVSSYLEHSSCCGKY
jgi:hypothetical protein